MIGLQNASLTVFKKGIFSFTLWVWNSILPKTCTMTNSLKLVRTCQWPRRVDLPSSYATTAERRNSRLTAILTPGPAQLPLPTKKIYHDAISFTIYLNFILKVCIETKPKWQRNNGMCSLCQSVNSKERRSLQLEETLLSGCPLYLERFQSQSMQSWSQTCALHGLTSES